MRKEVSVVVPKFDGTDNRDIGKTFFLKEWDADRAENWLIKVTLAYNRSGGQIPMELAGIGWEGIGIIGINTFLRGNVDSAEIIPLFNELLECVKIIRDPKHPDVITQLTPDDIEEVATRLWLRNEVLRLHLGFSPADVLWTLLSRILTKPVDSSST